MSAPVDVRFELAQVIRKLERDGDEHGVTETLHEIGAAMAELIEQRDALTVALVELARALPKGRKSLSQIARQRRDNGERVAWSILNHHEVDPGAYDRIVDKARVQGGAA